MNVFPEKRSFAKSICAFSIAAMIVISSLMSVAAAITAPNDNSINAGDNSDVERHYSPMPKSVVLDIDGKTSTESFQGGTVAEFLEATETKVGENQIVIPSLSTVVADGTTVYVRTAKPVQVTDGGKTKLMVLSHGTVSEAPVLSRGSAAAVDAVTRSGLSAKTADDSGSRKLMIRKKQERRFIGVPPSVRLTSGRGTAGQTTLTPLISMPSSAAMTTQRTPPSSRTWIRSCRSGFTLITTSGVLYSSWAVLIRF